MKTAQIAILFAFCAIFAQLNGINCGQSKELLAEDESAQSDDVDETQMEAEVAQIEATEVKIPAVEQAKVEEELIQKMKEQVGPQTPVSEEEVKKPQFWVHLCRQSSAKMNCTDKPKVCKRTKSLLESVADDMEESEQLDKVKLKFYKKELKCIAYKLLVSKFSFKRRSKNGSSTHAKHGVRAKRGLFETTFERVWFWEVFKFFIVGAFKDNHLLYGEWGQFIARIFLGVIGTPIALGIETVFHPLLFVFYFFAGLVCIMIGGCN